MANQLKTGVVGAGVFGAFHASKHAASPRAELVGIWDIDGDRARALSSRCGVASFSSYSALLESVDAVAIASPAPTHFNLARQALESGRHIYVEKPLAMSVGEADALIALAEKSGLVLQVGHQERFVLEAMGAPRADAQPQRMEFVRCGPPSGRGEDVSVVFDLMIHDLDIARLFGFGRLLKASACGDRHETIATLVFEDGRQCSFIASRRADARRRRLRAEYEDGALDVDFLKRTASDATGAFRRASDAAFADPLGVSVEAFFASIIDGAKTAVDGKAGRGALEWAIQIDQARNSLNAMSAVADRLIA